MKTSKILKIPEFKPIPQTNAANVQENIYHWLKTNQHDKIEKFCIKDGNYESGYRFISTEDLDETVIIRQVIMGIECKISWFRRLNTSDHFCPLYFTEWFTVITVKVGDCSFEFKSDNDLKKRIREFKATE